MSPASVPLTRDDRPQEDRVLILDVRLRAKRYGETSL
jgi:hypothetical protein